MTHLVFKLEGNALSNITDVVSDAVRIAKQLNISVVVKYRAVVFKVEPDSNADEVLKTTVKPI